MVKKGFCRGLIHVRRRDSAKQNPMGSIWFFPFYCVWERVFGPFVSGAVIHLFKILKMFYPPKGLCEAEPNGVHLTVFPFYCVWERVFGPFVSEPVIRLFEILKMFYPPKGLCEAELSILLCLRKGVWTFCFSGGNPPFWNIKRHFWYSVPSHPIHSNRTNIFKISKRQITAAETKRPKTLPYTTIKWKDWQMDPIRNLLSQSPFEG